MRRWTRWTRREDGMATVLFALCAPIILGLGALVVDAGHGFAEKRTLQNAADAGALAGGIYLPSTDPTVLSTVRSAAIDYAARNGVTITAADVTFTSKSVQNDTIVVQTHSTVSFTFGAAIGISSSAVKTTSTAQIGAMIGGIGVMPWGLAIPTGGFAFGQSACLKLGSQGGGSECSAARPGDFQAIDIDNNNTSSGTIYKNLIASGSASVVHVGDVKNIVTGNMVGPTQQGTGCTGSTGRISGNTQTFSSVVQSTGAGTYTVLDWKSPRLVLVPVITTISSTQVRVSGFSVFFIESCGQNGAVIGKFIDTVVPSGIWGPYQAATDYGSRSVRLVG
jgi:Flp pilus assembly protein TadG